MKNAIFWDVVPCALVRSNILEEHIASIMRVTRICEQLLATEGHVSLQRALVARYC
jgi:hypothetical protein